MERPLPAKVEPLPKLSEHEAEARAVIFSVNLPEELAMLGSSFCLARHVLDFDAAHPCQVKGRPPFSWHSHVCEFSTDAMPSLGADARFELFADGAPSYRDGKQEDSYFLPVKQSVGFYQPSSELEGLQLLWRWQGVLLNPFETNWPQPGNPPKLCRMTFPTETEEWFLALPSENEVLAQLPVHFPGLSKAEFRSLGLIASRPELHIRRLLLDLHRGELPLEDERVNAVCQQVLYRLGPADVPNCLLGRSCKQDLAELAEWPSVKALPEQFQALKIEKGSIAALTCLMVCSGYLAQFACKNSHPAVQAIQTCRDVLQVWAQDARRSIRAENQGWTAQPSHRRLAKVLACYIASFRLVPADCKVLSDEDALLLAKARIELENCAGRDLLSQSDMQTVMEVCFLHENQLVGSTILDGLLSEFLPGQQAPTPSMWQPPQNQPSDMWRVTETVGGVVAVHPSRGILLFNGKSVGQLPFKIRKHPRFQAVFGDVSCYAWPLAKEGNLYEAGPLQGKTYILGLLGDELLVQEKRVHEDAALTLLPACCMSGTGLRKALVNNYTHWFSPHDSSVCFRPKGADDGREYRLQLYATFSGHVGSLSCSFNEIVKMQVFLASEPGLTHLVKALALVEPHEFVEYLGQNGRLMEVHLLRLGLKFELRDGPHGQRLKSLDFPRHQLAPTQQLQMLRGFHCFLLLEEESTSPAGCECWARTPGLVVMPEGEISFCDVDGRCGVHFEGARRKFSVFKIHWEDGHLEVETPLARLQLASVLWACSRAEPEPLFGRPGRWKSLELLRQCWRNQAFDEAGASASAESFWQEKIGFALMHLPSCCLKLRAGRDSLVAVAAASDMFSWYQHSKPLVIRWVRLSEAAGECVELKLVLAGLARGESLRLRDQRKQWSRCAISQLGRSLDALESQKSWHTLVFLGGLVNA